MEAGWDSHEVLSLPTEHFLTCLLSPNYIQTDQHSDLKYH